MAEESGNPDHTAAIAMLEAFASVGAECFDLTLTNLQGKKTDFRRGIHFASLQRDLPALLDKSTRQQENVILRPTSPQTVFIQLDDLTPENTLRLQPVSFLQLETSPGNFQAWVAMSGAKDEDFARRLRKGAEADATASGATRVAGSLNFKEKYGPNFPRIEIAHSSPGLLANQDQLIALKLVAAPEIAPTPAPSSFRVSGKRPGPDRRKWPSYQRCIEGAPPNHSKTGPDISRADFAWCMTAISWEWSIEDTAAHLLEVSPKAKENGERYALLTAQNAAAAVERNKRQRG